VNGMFQFLVFAADVNLLDENIILFRVVFCDIHGSISQKTTLNIILAAVRT
jgi:hypothetical protein